MLIRVLIFSVCLFVSSCAFYSNTEEPIHISIWQKVEAQYARDMKQKHDALLYSSGGEMMHDVNLVYLDFHMKKQLNLDEARELFVENVSDLISRINNAPKLRPYLSHYPYTAEGIGLQFMFFSRPNVRVAPPYIAGVTMKRGLVVYDQYDHHLRKFVEVRRESYEEAVEIVRGRKAA